MQIIAHAGMGGGPKNARKIISLIVDKLCSA